MRMVGDPFVAPKGTVSTDFSRLASHPSRRSVKRPLGVHFLDKVAPYGRITINLNCESLLSHPCSSAVGLSLKNDTAAFLVLSCYDKISV